jgi:hypothetical protein
LSNFTGLSESCKQTSSKRYHPFSQTVSFDQKEREIRKVNEKIVYKSLPHPEQSSSEPSLNLNLPLTKMPLDLRSMQLSYSVWCAPPLKFSIIG